MRHVVILSAVLSLAAALPAADKNLFVSDEHGFSIAAPATGEAPALQAVLFFLPASGQFAANVNVQKQRFEGGIADYDKTSTEQFKTFGLSVLNRSLKGNEVRYEYKGDMQGRPMHWYARAVKSGGHVYLVTATALEADWARQKAALTRSVDSFAAK